MQKLWFKRKMYGWGWYPAGWQGWLVLGAFMLFLLCNTLMLTTATEPTRARLLWFFVKVGLAVVVLLIICYTKGEKTRWRWGNSSKADKRS